MMNVVAANNSINPVSLERLRGECVKEVKRLNGSFSFDDAVSWQKGWEENEQQLKTNCNPRFLLI